MPAPHPSAGRVARAFAAIAPILLAAAAPAPAAPPIPEASAVHLAGPAPDGGVSRLRLEVAADSVRATWRPGPGDPAVALAGPAPADGPAALRLEVGMSAAGGERRLAGTLDRVARRFTGTWTAGRDRWAVDLEIAAEQVRRTWTCGPRLALELEYPHLSGDDPAVVAFAASLATELADRQAAFAAEGLPVLAGTEHPTSFWQQSLAGSLAVRTGDFVSVVVRDWHFTGGAHGNTTWSTVNARLDGDTPRPVELSELFRDGEREFEWLSQEILDDLRDQGASSVASGALTHLGPDDLEAWFVSPDGLTFLFDPYVAGSYAEGTYRVTIPLDRLGKRAAPDGPLARLRAEGR